MSKQYPGGIISKTPVTPSGPYETSTASGVWTLDQQAYWQELGQWPTAGNPPPDPQFNYVTMLLHGDGTNGAQNNTFLDSSTNNFTITRNGNTTQGSFSPYGSNWSNYFDGTGDYVQTGNATNLALGTGNFTIEGWFNRTGGSNNGLFQLSTTVGGFVASDVDNLAIGVAPTDLTLYANNSTSTSSTVSIPNGTWNHFALVRSGTTTTLYYNGVSVLSLTDSKNYTGTYLVVGGYYSTTYVWNGYISNLRIVKGTAVYTSNFTPPTAPLTAITNTQLLTCQTNRFIDSSSNAYALTVSGNTSVQRFNPFGASTAYSTSVIGGSGYFDGSGDYLTTPSSSALGFGTGDFTIECWTYLRDNNALYVFDMRFSSGADTYAYINASTLEAAVNGVSLSVSGVNFLNNWSHIAIVRASGTVKIYVNGVQQATASSSGSIANSGIAVGARYTGSESFNGYISNFRIVKGTAVYTSAFTPPTAPVTAITNTSLLLNYTNGAIFDNAMMNDLETAGNAQISTSVVKYGTGSLAFDGTGDFLRPPLSPMASLGGDFTVEFWSYLNNQDAQDFVGTATWANYIGAGKSGWSVSYTSSKVSFSYQNNNSYVIATTFNSTTLSNSTWNHVAVVRNNGTIKCYVNGVASATTISSSTNFVSTTYGVWVGAAGDADTYGYELNGYLDDVRITNGYARYTANFTPPTQAFQNFGPT